MKNGRTSIVLVVFFMAMTACQSSKMASQAQNLTNKDIIGNWKTIEARIELKTHNAQKKDSSFVLNAASLAKATQTQPPQTFIMGSGEYRDEIRNLEDSLLRSNRGFWHLNQDTLYLRLESQKGQKTRFHVRKRGRNLCLTNVLDWDADGETDDEMRIELKRMN